MAPRPSNPLSPDLEDLWAAAIRDIVLAAETFTRAAGDPPDMKPVREAIWFWWTGRINRRRRRQGEIRLIRDKYATDWPWSPEAVGLVRAGQEKGQLVVDHVIPSIIIYQRLAAVVDDLKEFRRVLESQQFAVLTVAQDKAISRAGYRHTIPDSADPWDRHRLAGLRVDDLKPFDDHLPTGADKGL